MNKLILNEEFRFSTGEGDKIDKQMRKEGGFYFKVHNILANQLT